jgi:flagellar hook-associated protein 3 FlgL
MSRIPSFNTRTSNLLQSDQLLNALRKAQREMLTAQEQLTTGKSLNRPGDDPSKVSATLLLRDLQNKREQTDINLRHALSSLDTADAALGDVSEVLLEAKGIAQTQIGIGSDAETRKTQATVIDGQIQALLTIANRQYQGVSVFGGNNSALPGDAVFESFLGGIRYKGTTTNLANDTGELAKQPFVTNGVHAFGALSTRVQSQIDVNPIASDATRIRDVTGGQNQPVRLGSVLVEVNGTQAIVDLKTADTLGDVASRINAVVQAIDPTAGLAVTTEGFELAGGASTVTIRELGTGLVAADLGISLTAGPGSTVAGADLNPKLTRLTSLADLGVAVDLASGLRISQGQTTKVADFSGAQTIEDMMNVIDRLNLGLRLEINTAGNGLNLISEVSGVSLSIGENGGTTARDLGLATFGADTALADFRHGIGVIAKEGESDFAIELHDGRSFEVNLDGLASVGQVVAAIEAAATAAGVTIPGEFSIGFASVGTGLVLTDNTVGGADFRVRQLNESLAATHLGIVGNAEAGATIAGTDNATLQVASVFTNLMNLRDALLNDDQTGITIAGGNIEDDLDAVAQARAEVGIQARRVQDSQKRSENLNVMEQSLLSDLQDTEIAEVITRLSLLQTQIQAAMQVGSSRLQQSLLDFI